ncbi:hypothetical protein V5799_022572 [Amblyomma americanum]|uniref:Uncharacterized protein n=1 Tax=Amblyomma americanum TaxID=6943 RepID=A0AAQ4FK31_AMBAM
MAVPQKRRTAIQEAAMLYRSCTDVYNGGRDNTDEAKALLQKFGISWPVVSAPSNVLRILSSVSATWYCGSVLRFEISALDKRLTITPAPFFQFLIERRAQLLQKGWDEERYRGLFEALVEAFALPDTGRPLTFEKHVMIEGTVLLLLRSAFTAPSWRTIQNATLDDVVDMTQKAKPRKAWEEELTAAFKAFVDVSFVVAVENVGFFLAFFDLLRRQGEYILAYYVGWDVVQLLALVSSADLIRHYFVVGDEAKEGHALFCVKLTYMYMSPFLYASYVRDHIGIDVLSDVGDVARSIEKASWDSATTWWQKASIAANLLSGRKLVDYLNTTRKSDVSIINQYTLIPKMSDNILTNMRVATWSRAVGSIRTSVAIMMEDGRVRFYHFSNGTLQLHPIAFQEPFYSSEALPAIKYGTVGAEIAYAMASRVLSIALPSNAELGEALRPRLACIFGHELATAELRVDQIELLQSLTSIRIALRAYLDRWRPNGGRLRDYGHLSGAQLFFLFWCFVQCGVEGGSSVCNDPARLIAGFADAFRCAKNSSMFTGKDCRTFEP